MTDDTKERNPIITTIIVSLIIGASFYGGVVYQRSQRPVFNGNGVPMMFRGANGQNMQTNGSRNGYSFQPVSGEIISSDGNSITVKMQDNSSKIIILNETTVVLKSESVSTSDLITGKKVVVMGQTNSDGSVTAQSVQLDPQTGMGGGQPR